jgi:hypothetical protein
LDVAAVEVAELLAAAGADEDPEDDADDELELLPQPARATIVAPAPSANITAVRGARLVMGLSSVIGTRMGRVVADATRSHRTPHGPRTWLI